jgi:quinol monooxygenase YgiN
MDNESVRVVARMIAMPEKDAELTALLLGLIDPTRKENGCVSYQLLRNVTNACELVLVEEWENTAALDAHLSTPHLQETFVKAKPLLAKFLDVRKYVAVSSERAECLR